MQSPISIGCECGGPQDGGISRLKVELFHALEKYVRSAHCNEIDQYALVLRVDGALATFGAEGVHRIRFARKSRYIAADIQIPESIWRQKNEADLRPYLGSLVRRSIEACVARLKKDGLPVAEGQLYAEIDSAISSFIASSSGANKSSQPTPYRGG